MNDEKRLMGEYSAYRRIGMELGMKEGLKEGREKGLKEGREEGLKEGREEGLKEGREEGLKEGREEGVFEGKTEIIRQMYYNGMKKEHIEEMTGLSILEIDKMLSK